MPQPIQKEAQTAQESGRVGLAFVRHVALRYFRTARRDAFGRVLSRMTTGGLIVGVAALILALAALSGFQQELLSDVRSRTPHIQVELTPSTDSKALVDKLIARPEVARVQRIELGRAWILERGELLPVEVVGYETELPEWFPAAHGNGSGLVVSDRMMERFVWQFGDAVRIVSPRSTLTPIGPQPRTRQLEVTGSYEASRSPHEFVRVGLPLDRASSLLGASDQRLDVRVEDFSQIEALAATLRRDPADLRVTTWFDENRALLFVLRLEKGLIFVAVALIIVVASFALMSSLALLLASKQGEIAVLSTLGASKARLRLVFLALGGLLAGGGAVVGGTVGVAASLLLDRFEVLRLPGEVFLVDHVPFVVRPTDVAVVVLATMLVTLLASLWASRRAVSLQPIEALRGARR